MEQFKHYKKFAWQNTGMPDQVIYEYLRPVVVKNSRLIKVEGSMTELAKDNVVNVYTYDRKWHFEVHFGKKFHYVNILSGFANGKDITFKNAVYGMTDATLELRGVDADDTDSWGCGHSWITLFDKFNELYRHGYTYVWNDAVKHCLHDLCEACDLGVDSNGESIHFFEWTDDETHEDGWFVCDDELYHELHDGDACFVFHEIIAKRRG